MHKWLKGLLAAVINGCASGVVLVIVDPAAFDLANWQKLLVTSGLLGALGAANYLKQSPVPPDDGMTVTVPR